MHAHAQSYESPSVSTPISTGTGPSLGRFDGVVCFGGVDWWYHNRGHYDLQMMREFSTVMPVLYINSIGMRMPKVGSGSMFFHRIKRKLKSISRGVVPVRDNFWVFSPVNLPGKQFTTFSKKMLPIQVRWAMKKAGIKNPLLWVAVPTAQPMTEKIEHVGLMYQRTDRFEAFKGADPALIRGYDRKLKAEADVTLYCSHSLMEQEKHECSHAEFIDHGVDYRNFEKAGIAADENRKQVEYGATDPEDVCGIARPRVGFVGGIDSHTFDPDLFVEVAQSLSDMQFVLVGGCTLPDGWCDLPNVHMLGQKPYEQVAQYMAAFDVLIMPWNQSEWIQACNPIKLKEYLAVGRPIVSTPFAELDHYRGLVTSASGTTQFVRAIREAIEQSHDPSAGRKRVQTETWTHKASNVLRLLDLKKLAPTRQSSRLDAMLGRTPKNPETDTSPEPTA
ncbi:MAG: glycosyltransferase [Phycisphaeraceae bacterium]|nr:glycosyltransferase [Phycisphaerales bacterium]MCB9860995.1 glycosyltransferase [Phycisphaeraceae bacterium]